MTNLQTKICFLLGNPVEHSLSPVMQNAAFLELGLDFVYLAFKINESMLEKTINGLKRVRIRGANVTIPHKVNVMKFLDEVDDLASKICAVNTILNDNGTLKGFNTDASGFSKTLKENDVKIRGKKVVLLGAGGAARAIAFSCILEGADVTIINRSRDRANELKDVIKRELQKDVKSLSLSESEKLGKELEESGIMINATSVGMFPKTNECIIPKTFLHQDLVVMDIVYNPIETKLLRYAKEMGCKKIIPGIEMLVQQGAISFELWTKKKAPIEVMRKAVLSKLNKGR